MVATNVAPIGSRHPDESSPELPLLRRETGGSGRYVRLPYPMNVGELLSKRRWVAGSVFILARKSLQLPTARKARIAQGSSGTAFFSRHVQNVQWSAQIREL